jgi:oxygen-independent coproporphyrinogen-3 oxidase
MVLALGAEISMRKPEGAVHSMQTIYFGGGTPSLLPVSELAYLIKTVRK